MKVYELELSVLHKCVYWSGVLVDVSRKLLHKHPTKHGPHACTI